MIDNLRSHFPVPGLCRILHVSSSGYYKWRKEPISTWQREELRLELEIRAAHRRTRETYGPERLREELAANGIDVGVHRIKRIRKKLGLKCKQTKKYKATTNSNHKLPVADNLLRQNFQANAPCRVWLSDITYIRTNEGWLYLAGHKDIFTGEIVGYAMSSRMTKELVVNALFRAVTNKRPAQGLILHSDRGSQYCSRDFARSLSQFGMVPSMSRRGNCFDNAPMESFWGTLKTELIYSQDKFRTRKEAELAISEYIEVFYNRQRIQKKLGYVSPVVFEQHYQAKQRTEERFGVHY